MYRDLLGKKYERGVMDCIVLAQEVFRRNGIEVPVSEAARSAVDAMDSENEQWKFISDVIKSTWQEIDKPTAPCLVTTFRAGYVDHVGVYIGNGSFIHISKLRQYPTIERLDNPLYANRRFYTYNSSQEPVQAL